MGGLIEPRKILVLRVRAFGDTLLTTPTLRSLKAAWPQAHLTVLVETAMQMVLRGLPYVDEILTFDRQASKRLSPWDELKFNLKLWRRLRRERYDLVVDVLGTPRTAWLAWISGAPLRVGFGFRVRRLAYNLIVEPSKQRKYMADFIADLLRALGHEPDSLKLDFIVPEASRDRAEDFFSAQGWKKEMPLAVQGAGGWDLKRYPVAFLSEALALMAKNSGRPLLYLWGPGEREQTENLCRVVGAGGVLAPETDFADMAALLERCALLLTNDNATKHLAVAIGCPTLTIFGPTSDVTWHPPNDLRHRSVRLDLDCMPCEALTCRLGTHACMRELAPRAVAEAALEML